MKFDTKDLRNNSFALLRRVERQNQLVEFNNINNKNNDKKICNILNDYKKETKNHFKNDTLYNKTKTKLGLISKKR